MATQRTALCESKVTCTSLLCLKGLLSLSSIALALLRANFTGVPKKTFIELQLSQNSFTAWKDLKKLQISKCLLGVGAGVLKLSEYTPISIIISASAKASYD